MSKADDVLRRPVEIKVWDNVPKLRYAIRAYEFRGGGHVNNGDGTWTYMPPSFEDRWHNFKVHCLAWRYRITDKFGLTKP